LAARIVAPLIMLAVLVHAEHEGKVRKHFSPKVAEEILAAQHAVVRADAPGGFYEKSYEHAEPFYWWQIPGWMEEDAAHRHAKRVLDIGCGYGTLLSVTTTIYGAHGYCMDVTPYLMPPVAARRSLQFSKGNIELDPIPWGGGFDVIIMTEVLEHFNFQPVPTLRKIRDALAPEGLFFLSTPDAKEWGRTQKYYKRLQDIPMPSRGKAIVDDHVWQYSEQELRQVLKDAGFSVVRWDYAPGTGFRHFNVVLKRAS
jgi:2-polyprenyl-3-methyl-5-hydroxy-6-metoxy-1,4-benzoquinol methylase